MLSNVLILIQYKFDKLGIQSLQTRHYDFDLKHIHKKEKNLNTFSIIFVPYSSAE